MNVELNCYYTNKDNQDSSYDADWIRRINKIHFTHIGKNNRQIYCMPLWHAAKLEMLAKALYID